MGRPLKLDVDHDLVDVIQCFSTDEFKNEKELCCHIEMNLSSICNEIGIEMESYERESYIVDRVMFGCGNRPRIDFVVNEKNGCKTLMEVKKPKNIHREINMAISQMLGYILIAEKEGVRINKAVILTTTCNEQFLEIIKRFNLPIDVIVISKHQMALWQKG